MSLLHPILLGPLPLARVGGSALAWPDGEPLVVDLSTALVLPYLDGSTDLGELVEDAAAALDLDPAVADDRIRVELDALIAAGVVGAGATDDGVHGPGAIGEPEAPTILEVIEKDGQTTVLSQLPDGRFQRTVSTTISATSSVDTMRDALATNALTDLLGADSCVGFKLRAGQPAIDLVIAVGDREARVRVDHPPTLEALRRRLGAHLLDEAELVRAAAPVPGGVEDGGEPWVPSAAAERRHGLGVTAYVIGPLDGEGPARVYDRWGNRAGRPADADSAAIEVGHLLTEELPPPYTDGMLAHALPVLVPGGCVLLVDVFRDAAQLHRRLRRLGLEAVDCRRIAIHRDGTAEFEEAWPSQERRTVAIRGVIALDDGSTADAAASAGRSFLTDLVATGPVAAQHALDLLSAVVSSVPAVAVPADRHGSIPEIVEAMGRGHLPVNLG